MARVSEVENKLIEAWGDLSKVIPAMVNQHGQEETARRLGVKQAWVSRWLRNRGYVKVSNWIQIKQLEPSA